MQVYKDTPFQHQPLFNTSHNSTSSSSPHPASPYNMSLPQSSIPQPPYNPYHYSSHPQSTLSAPTSAPTVSASASQPPASGDMLFALEKLLMGISPFPPSIPTLAKPTCPAMDDQTMSEMCAPSSSSSPSSTTSSVPSIVLNEQSLDVLQQYYQTQENRHHQSLGRPVPQPSAHPHHHQSCHHQQQQIGHRVTRSDCSSISHATSPPASPYSHTSSMASPPNPAVDSPSDPYWSPSTPSMQVDHTWSSHSSPLVLDQQYPPQPTPPQSQRLSPHQGHHRDSLSWGYPLFEQVNLPMGMSDLGGYISSVESQRSLVGSNGTATMASFSSRPGPFSTLPSSRKPFKSFSHHNHHRRISSGGATLGLRAYESTAHRGYHSHSNTFSTSQKSSNNNGDHQSSDNNNNNNNNSKSNNNTQNGSNGSSSYANNSSNTTSATTNGSTSSSTNSSTSSTVRTGTRTVKSYPCPTCTKPFPTRTQLKSHMAIHVDRFPFPCLYTGCDLHFKRKHDLRRHVDAKHALVKKYLCSGGCGEGFGRRDQMVRHLRRGVCSAGFQTD